MDPYDERVLIRQVGFANGQEVREREWLRLEGKKPGWLVGRLYWLAPGLIDLHYETVEGEGWWGGAQRLQRHSRHLGHWWDAVPHLWVFDLPAEEAEGAWVVARIPGEEAAAAWLQTPEGIPSDASLPIAHTLWLTPPRSLGTRINEALGRLADALRRPFVRTRPIKPAQVIAGDAVVLLGEGLSDSSGRVLLQGGGQPLGQQIDPANLRPHRTFDWSAEGMAGSRPVRCPATGHLFNLHCDYRWPLSTYRVVRLAADQEAGAGGEVGRFLAPPTLLLSLAITRTHAIVPLQPHRLRRAGEHHYGGHLRVGILEDWQWQAEQELLFYVIHLASGCLKAVWRSEAALLPYGPLNAFEAHDTIYMDAVAYDDDRFLNALAIDRLRQLYPAPTTLPAGQLRRYCLTSVACETARFDGAAGQMERYPEAPSYPLAEHLLGGVHGAGLINGQLVGLPHRHVWALGERSRDRGREGGWPNALLRLDGLVPGKPLEWSADFCYPSHPVFVSRLARQTGELKRAKTPPISSSSRELEQLLHTPPRSLELESLQATPTTPTQRARLQAESAVIGHGEAAEADGILLSVVLNVRQQKSFLLMLDAQRMEEIGRYWLPQSVPLSWSQGAWSTGLSVSGDGEIARK